MNDFGGDHFHMQRAHMGYCEPGDDQLSWAEEVKAEARRLARFNTYCRLRTNGETHADLTDEYGQEAEGFRVEYETQMERYRKAMEG